MKRRLLAPTPARRALPTRLLTGAGAIAIATLTSSCAIFSPVQTDVPYDPADGVPVNVGKLALRDLVLVGDGSGDVVLSGSAINLGSEPLTVQITLAAPADAAAGKPTGAEIKLGPREQVHLAKQGLILSNVDVKPGRVVPVQVTSSIGGTTLVSLPLLPATGYYSTVTPGPRVL